MLTASTMAVLQKRKQSYRNQLKKVQKKTNTVQKKILTRPKITLKLFYEPKRKSSSNLNLTRDLLKPLKVKCQPIFLLVP